MINLIINAVLIGSIFMTYIFSFVNRLHNEMNYQTRRLNYNFDIRNFFKIRWTLYCCLHVFLFFSMRYHILKITEHILIAWAFGYYTHMYNVILYVHYVIERGYEHNPNLSVLLIIQTLIPYMLLYLRYPETQLIFTAIHAVSNSLLKIKKN